MEAAPRSWQAIFSNWSVARKVAIALLPPVILAMSFAVLRVDNHLDGMEQVRAASEYNAATHQIIEFAGASTELAVTAVNTQSADPADPRIGKANTRFDRAVADLETALRLPQTDPVLLVDMNSAIAAAKVLRDKSRATPPTELSTQLDAILGYVDKALASSDGMASTYNNAQRYMLQTSSIMVARRAFAQQQMLIGMMTSGKNTAPQQEQLAARILTAAGSEMALIQVYDQIMPTDAPYQSPLLGGAMARMAAVADPTRAADLVESMRTSLATYDLAATDRARAVERVLSEALTTARQDAMRDTSIIIGTLLAGLALALWVAQALVMSIRRLRHDVLDTAHVRLPEELAIVYSGGSTPQITPVGVTGRDEIGQLARAVDEMHEQALNLAALRLQIGKMFETLSRRSQSLVEQQLTLIEELERNEEDPIRLQSMFRLDHLATRMRRNGDNLLVLAGTPLRRGHLEPVGLGDMLWSAISQVEDYQRAEIGSVPNGIVPGAAAVDIEHLLAELIDNALRYSPPDRRVGVGVARTVDGGYLIEIIDRGLGMSDEDLAAANNRLASGGQVNFETARRMGLFVVSNLSARHGIQVSLRRTASTASIADNAGITAAVHLPARLVSLPESDHPTAPVLPLSHTSSPRLQPVPDPEPAETPAPQLTAYGLPRRLPLPPEAEPEAEAAPEISAPAGYESRFTLDAVPRHIEPVTDPAPSVPLRPDTEPATDPAPSVPLRPVADEPESTFGPPIFEPVAAEPDEGGGAAPIYQRMVSEWLVDSAASDSAGTQWSSPADSGWQAAAQASTPASSGRTRGGLPIRRPGAQLVPGSVDPSAESGIRDPEEIRENLTRHLNGVFSGRRAADAKHEHGEFV
ncbi:ATP-binding protein [Nocardia goodfellowii]|uniref:histidine kinase n=1 Tax=Nocardia goodfellowii TaxID=882446 RepID=A0ABS4QBD7_9NOCA|nr:ATP-binding protein [Nocardia goodfellowii]MBP2189007.1 signal transduction histidine kinase [Nocardia goodfellowii]